MDTCVCVCVYDVDWREGKGYLDHCGNGELQTQSMAQSGRFSWSN